MINLEKKWRYNKDELLQELKRVAISLNKNSASQAEFADNSYISTSTYKKQFKTWNNALKEAGLEIVKKGNRKTTEYFRAFEKYLDKYNRYPSRTDWRGIEPFYGITYADIKNRFGGMSKFIVAYKALNDSSPLSSEDSSVIFNSQTENQNRITGVHIPIIGDPFNLGPFCNMPLSETHVCMLLVPLLGYFGFQIRGLNSNKFPDIMAIEKLNNGRHKDIFIEIEVCLSNYLKHRHPLNFDGIIVCWQNDLSQDIISKKLKNVKKIIVLQDTIEELRNKNLLSKYFYLAM